LVAWVKRLQLNVDDDVFCAVEAHEMRRALAALSDAPTDFARETSSTSLRAQSQLLETLTAQGRTREAFAITFSAGLRQFGNAGQAVLTSSSLGTALNATNSFAPLLNSRHHTCLCVRDGEIILSLSEHSPGLAGRTASLLALDAVKLARFLIDLFPKNVDRSLLHIGTANCSDLASFCEQIGVTGVRSTPVGQIRIPIFFAKIRLPGSCQLANRGFEKTCRDELDAMLEARMCESVRRVLVENDDGFPCLEQVANHLGFSARTFRRRLSDQGYSFTQIVDSVRCSLALDYLLQTSMTTEAIAERLGYSESANFRHAFRRWTGSSPRHFTRMASVNSQDPRACLIQRGARVALEAMPLLEYAHS
jgi:AraC-like DNA-binding protein